MKDYKYLMDKINGEPTTHDRIDEVIMEMLDAYQGMANEVAKDPKPCEFCKCSEEDDREYRNCHDEEEVGRYDPKEWEDEEDYTEELISILNKMVGETVPKEEPKEKFSQQTQDLIKSMVDEAKGCGVIKDDSLIEEDEDDDEIEVTIDLTDMTNDELKHVLDCIISECNSLKEDEEECCNCEQCRSKGNVFAVTNKELKDLINSMGECGSLSEMPYLLRELDLMNEPAVEGDEIVDNVLAIAEIGRLAEMSGCDDNRIFELVAEDDDEFSKKVIRELQMLRTLDIIIRKQMSRRFALAVGELEDNK